MSRRIALVSDVHGNLPALEAVLADADGRGAQAVWNLGDFVGYGPHGDRVVRLLRKLAEAAIRGNYDRKVLRFPEKRKKWRRKKDPEKFLAFQQAWEDLSDPSRKYLAELPGELRHMEQHLRVLLVHGSPAADDEPLGPDTPARRLAELARMAEADLVFCGHTHRAWMKRSGRTWFVNPGSVGRPEGLDCRAAYAVLDFADGRWGVEFHRVPYDVDRVARALRRAGMPDDFSRMLREGRNLDQVHATRKHPQTPDDGSEMPDDGSRFHRDDSSRSSPFTPCCPKCLLRTPCPPRAAPLLRAALHLARRCDYEQEHSHQVTRLALSLLDSLQPLLVLTADDRLLLHCGALLHDIGWMEGQKAHHKTAMRIILADETLPLDAERRRLVALIARCHRKAPPAADDPDLSGLSPGVRRRALLLGGIVRIADGLDYSHRSLARLAACHISPGRISVICRGIAPGGAEASAATKKADLLSAVLSWSVEILPA